MNNAVFSGSYADFKLVKTRSVVSVSIEMPLDQAERFVEMFGLPKPGEEIHVAIARLVAEPEPQPITVEAQPAPNDLRKKAVVRASILCGERAFQRWIHGLPLTQASAVDGNTEATAEALRKRIGIESRREISSTDRGFAAWQNVEDQYERACGRRP